MQAIDLSHSRLLILRVSAAERESLLATSGRSKISMKFVQTDAEFLEAAHSRATAAMIWEVSRRMPPTRNSIACGLMETPTWTPFLVRADLTPAATREIAVLSRPWSGSIEWAVSLIGFDDLSHDIARLVDTRQVIGGATTAIIRSIVPLVPPPIDTIVATAAIIGRTRTSVDELARRCGWRVETMRAQLRKLGGPSPHHLLGSCLLLHTAWRLEVEGLSPKEAACAAGYSGLSPWSAMSEYVLRRSGLRLRRLGKEPAFTDLLDAFVGVFGR